VIRLTTAWQDERELFSNRSLKDVDYVYCWADGIHFNVRLEDERLCALVIVGVRADGRKELVAICDGQRESTGAWADLLRDAKRRGMRAPVVMVGDGALGMWGALGEVFPETRHQRCWVRRDSSLTLDRRSPEPRIRPQRRRDVARGVKGIRETFCGIRRGRSRL